MKLIEIDHLTYHYPDTKKGIENIHLDIGAGEFVVLAGPNGSGKTTFLRHLNGLILPDAGCVRIRGGSVSENILQARKSVGMVFQDADSQIVGETVYEDVVFGPENLGLQREEIFRRAIAALETVGLGPLADRRTDALSGGEKRKLAIAGILAMEPEILVFDEPFSDLDYPGTRQVLEQILSLHRAGYTILLTTHDLEKVIFYADRLLIMNEGRIVRDGIPSGIVGEVEKFGVRQPCALRLGKEIVSWL